MFTADAPQFHDDDTAREFLEAIRWPDGPVCPHCGTIGEAYKTERKGLYRCASPECRKDFTVTVGTLFERSHVPLRKWLMATHLLMSSKKGVSSHQLHRMLGVTYKTAWFMSHRIREALREGHFSGPLGGEGKTVEMDEAYIGGLEKNKHRRKRKHAGGGGKGKEAVFSLVERGGAVRSHHVPTVNAKTLRPILVSQVKRSTALMSDESVHSKTLGQEYERHQTVNHSIGEYVRGDAHTNTIEGYFSIMKRGIHGIYHHVSPQHLKRYLAEYDFRYNERSRLGVDDAERTVKALKGIEGKRLTYQGPQAR